MEPATLPSANPGSPKVHGSGRGVGRPEPHKFLDALCATAPAEQSASGQQPAAPINPSIVDKIVILGRHDLQAAIRVYVNPDFAFAC